MAGGAWDDGDNQGYANTVFLNIDTKTWTSGPDMSVARSKLTCNLVNKPFLGIVLIGGGNCQFQGRCGGVGSNLVEILNLETNEMTEGKEIFQKPEICRTKVI